MSEKPTSPLGDATGVLSTAVLLLGDPRRGSAEHALLARGVDVSVYHRAPADAISGSENGGFVAVSDEENRPLFGFAYSEYPLRALPGHRLLRVRKFGGVGAEERAVFTGLEALAEVARCNWRVLRLQLDVFETDEVRRRQLEQELARLGFTPAVEPEWYSVTVMLELAGSEQELFAGLHRRARRNIRTVQKNPVSVRAITDFALAGRMGQLLRETMARTGGNLSLPYKLEDVIMLARQHPDLARVVGLFDDRLEGPEALLAFSVGLNHGNIAEYFSSASTRNTDLNIPLAYGLAWDLILWAKDQGATRFDFGGITPGTHEDTKDPLGGISDFKRHFTTNTVVVGGEWVLQPRPVRGKLARGLGRAIGLIRRAVAAR